MSLKKLAVKFQALGENWELGTLIEKDSNIYFQYSEKAQKLKIEFSPIRVKNNSTVYQNFPNFLDKLPGFVSDSLPDGWGRLLMDRFFASKGVSIFNVSCLDRLAFLNDRAVGALAFEPGTDEDLSPKELDLLTYSKESIAISEEKESAALIDLLYQGGSPHGARPKALINYNPLTGDKGQDWLVKFRAATEHKEVCAIESWYLDMAQKCELSVMDHGYVNLDEENAAFAIKRFDRRNNQKIMLQTLAGILHIDYRIPGTIDYMDYLKVVKIVTRSDVEVWKAYRHCVFNVAFNNKDDHSKNFSFEMTKDFKWICAPAYDLTHCTGPGGEHHMAVMGKGKDISRADLIQLALKSGLDAKKADIEIDKIVEIAQNSIQDGEYYPIRGKTLSQINKDIQQNLKCLKK